jgi:hypothetical protein
LLDIRDFILVVGTILFASGVYLWGGIPASLTLGGFMAIAYALLIRDKTPKHNTKAPLGGVAAPKTGQSTGQR